MSKTVVIRTPSLCDCDQGANYNWTKNELRDYGYEIVMSRDPELKTNTLFIGKAELDFNSATMTDKIERFIRNQSKLLGVERPPRRLK